MTQALPMLDENLTLAEDLLETVSDFAEFYFWKQAARDNPKDPASDRY